GNEVLAVFGQVAAGVAKDATELGQPILDKKEIGRDADDVGWPWRGDLGVTADDEGVGVMARMAPAVIAALAQRHEGADVKERVVEPARPERRAVRELVMAVIGGRIEDAVDGKGWNRP